MQKNGIIGTDHRTDIFMGWQVIIPSGVTTKVHAVSDHRIFQTLKGVLSLSHRTDSLPRYKRGSQVNRKYRNKVPQTTNPERDASNLSFCKKT
jgi:hypothetical protein